jgi:hypothetical protein
MDASYASVRAFSTADCDAVFSASGRKTGCSLKFATTAQLAQWHSWTLRRLSFPIINLECKPRWMSALA